MYFQITFSVLAWHSSIVFFAECTFESVQFAVQIEWSNERKQVRYHSNQVEFFHSFFGSIEDTKRSFEGNWPLVSLLTRFNLE